MTLSWLAPAAVWKDSTVATGMPGREGRRLQPAGEELLALVQRGVGRHEVERQVVAGTLPVDDAGQLVAGPNVTPTLDCPSVMSRTTHVWWNDWITCPTSPPAPTTG